MNILHKIIGGKKKCESLERRNLKGFFSGVNYKKEGGNKA